MSGESPDPARPEVTQLLSAAGAGDRAAAERLLEVVYDELREMARARLAADRSATLQATALVHEVWLKLSGGAGFENRAHFFGAAAQAMRQVLVSEARRRAASKRGGDVARLGDTLGGEGARGLDGIAAAEGAPPHELLALDAALARFEAVHPRAAKVVALRFFAGLEFEQIAAVLELSARSVERDWRFARAWLKDAM